MAVRLGPSGVNVVDLAVSEDALYTLDAVESSVRAFGLDVADQAPTPATLLMRKGAVVGARRLETPVAMQYAIGSVASDGVLTVVDEARTVVQIGHDGSVSTRSLRSSASWRQLGALAADAGGALYILDSASHRLLEYDGASTHLVDPPRPLLDLAPIDDAGWEHAAEVLPLADIFLRLDDGQVRRLDR